MAAAGAACLDTTITHVRLLGATTHFLISSSVRLAAAGGSPATSWSLVSSPQPSPAQHTPPTLPTYQEEGSALAESLLYLCFFTYVGRFFPRFSSNSWTRASLMANSWMEFCLFTGSFHSRPGFRRSLATGALWLAGGRARGHGIARRGARCYGNIRLEPRYVGLLCVAAAAACRGLEPRYTSPPARPAPPRHQV